MEAEAADTDVFTYETEVLPEIEIRELVSFDELIASLPTFVAFNEDEILQYMSQLVEDKHKGSVFYKAYNLVRNMPPLPTEHIVPILSTSVEDVSEVMLLDIVREIEEAGHAPNYQSQMDEIAKVTYPLEKINGNFKPIVPVTVGLERGTRKRFVLLPKDTVSQELYGIAYRPVVATSESHVHERVGVHEIPPFPNTDDILVGKTMDDAAIPFQLVCDQLTDFLDAHGLRVHLTRYGYTLDQLNEEEMQMLVTKIQTLVDSEPEAEPAAVGDSEKPTGLGPPTMSRQNLWDAYAQASERPIDKDKYFAAWQSLSASISLAAPAVEVPYDVLAIALGLVENKYTIEDVIASLKYKRTLAEYETLRGFLDNIQSTTQNDVGALIDKERVRWSSIYTAYVDRVNAEFVESYKDMSEVKEGRKDDNYIGDADNVIFEEQANQQFVPTDEDLDDEVIDDEPEIYKLDINLSNVSKGCKEVLESVLPRLMKIKAMAGLPLDLDALVSYISNNIVRISREEYLQTAVPQLAIHIKNQLVTMDLQRALNMASFITPTDLVPTLKAAIDSSWKSYESDIRSVFILAIGWWVLDLQDKALARELTFDTMRGFLPCIRKFSPWGPPLQSDKGEGALEYIACVAKETNVWLHSMDELKQAVMRLWDDDARVEDMKLRYKELGKNAATMNERAKAANLSLAEVIENKQKQKYLPEYVKAYMLLPGLLASHQPKVAYGCCLQKIGESYRADSDWRGILKRVGNVKDAFAKKRMTMAEMPPSMVYAKTLEAAEMSDLKNVASAISVQPPSYFPLKEWLDEWNTMNLSFITPDMVQLAYDDMNKAVSLCEKFVQMAATTASTKTLLHPFMQEQASWSYYDQLVNVILTALHRESTTYMDGAEKDALNNSLTELMKVKHHMQKLRGLFQDVEFSIVRPLYAFIISRAVCLPAVPEASKTKRLAMVGTYNANFLTKTVKASLDALRQYISMKSMPTLEEHKEFITNVREQQKVEVLEVLDKKNIDDRQLLLDAKKLGLVQIAQKPTGKSLEEEERELALAEEEDIRREYRYQGQNQDENDMEGLNDD